MKLFCFNEQKITLIFGLLIGIIIGFIISGLLLIFGLEMIGNSVSVESINTTVNIPFNSSEFAESMTKTMIENKGGVIE